MNQKSRTVAACALFLMLGFTVFGLGRLSVPQAEDVTVVKPSPLPDASPQYLLKQHGEFLAVFAGDNPNTPLEITEIHVSSLRHYDRERLKRGIAVDSREDLLLLLEDYGS